ncbi:MAG TPA: gamma-glutamyltransferase [Solirubrobacteraceae bacterium]|nr:gamma-glutamyltransferase [Solirubrobacteraceae bacterium]
MPGLIATPHHSASEAGAEALAAGGTAVDAALAAAAVLTVVYPHNCALGGDLFALLRQPGGTVHAINASGTAPARTQPAGSTGRQRSLPLLGVETITVPGLVAGWGRLHELGARLAWPDALAAATRLAADGAPVAPGLADAIGALPSLESNPALFELLAPGRTRLRAGEMLVQSRLAATLERLARGGPREFYCGEIAAELAGGLSRLGSRISPEDLAGYAIREDPPLRAEIGACELVTCAPNSSGVLLSQALLALAATGRRDPLGHDAGVLAAIFAAGSEQRERMLGDPEAHPFEPDPWLGEQRIEQIARDALALGGGSGPALPVSSSPRPGGDTVGIVALDSEGRAVALIQSLFHSFGAQVLEPSTGILLHNRGAGFSLERDHPNALGPGRRPAHTLMPVLVEREGRLLGVLGAMGGRIQPQAHAQVLLRMIAGTSPEQAVAAPRFAVGPMELGEPPGTARFEEDCDPAVPAALTSAGFDPVAVPVHSDYLGHVQAIWTEGEPRAGSDPRADGSAVTVR